MPKNPPRRSVSVTSDSYLKFAAMCAQRGVSVSSLVQRFMVESVNAAVANGMVLPEPPPRRPRPTPPHPDQYFTF